MLTDFTITAADVARAEDDAHRCKNAWKRYDFREVTDAELSEARAHVSQADGELRRLHSSAWRAAQFQFGLYWIIDHTGVGTWGWLVGGLMAGTAAVALSAVPLVLIFGRLVPILVGFALCFLAAGSATATVLARLAGRSIPEEVSKVRARLRARRESISTLHERREGWRNHLSLLRRARHAQEDYEGAARRHARLVELLNSRRYRLVHADWRSLRGTAFEDFVGQVFEELGYTVEKTKVTGDQGVDLIIRGKGRTIAVQAKGYEGTVGNGAIQEVYAGMAFYRCWECVAVTNSYFTSGAIDLARSVGCTLIDGRHIPELIDGQLY
jgi:hypothetical protein